MKMLAWSALPGRPRQMVDPITAHYAMPGFIQNQWRRLVPAAPLASIHQGKCRRSVSRAGQANILIKGLAFARYAGPGHFRLALE